MSETKTKFSANILAIAGLITALGGFIVMLNQTFFINKKNEPQEIKINKPKKEKYVDKKTKPIIELEKKDADNIKIIIPVKKETLVPVEHKKEVLATKINVTNYNLTGYWFDSVHNGRYYFNHESSGRISFQEYSFLEGNWIVTAEGIGTFNNNIVNIPYNTLYNTSGLFTGNITSNGLVLKGNVHDNFTGINMQLTMNKE